MERSIRVKGQGKLMVAPDTIRFYIILENKNESYEEAMNQSNDQTKKLKNCLVKIGLDKEQVKTIHFNIEPLYDSFEDKDHNWVRRFEGYKVLHKFKVDIPNDSEWLGRILYALAHCSIHTEFSLCYTVKDIEACKDMLLKNAIADSMHKAEILTHASGTKLGSIITIDYSWDDIAFVSKPMGRAMESCMLTDTNAIEGYDMDITPDYIEVSDTVTVIWGLE